MSSYTTKSNTTGSALTLLRISSNTIAVADINDTSNIFIVPNDIGNLYDRPTFKFH